MSRTHNISFEYELDELGTTIDVEARVVFPHPDHPHPMDPDHGAECEITRVSKDDYDLDSNLVRLLRKDIFVSLTDILEEYAWDEAANQGEEE